MLSGLHRLGLVLFGVGAPLVWAAACGTASSPSTGGTGGESFPPGFGGGPTRSTDPYDPDAALGARVEALFSSCTGGPENVCHGVAAANLTLRLGPDGDVVGVSSTERPELLRVRPFAPLASYLYLKVLGDGGIEGDRMPRDGDFEQRRVDLIASWIEAGAPSP